jgi:putative spermidine/putrescine transport system permease protein
MSSSTDAVATVALEEPAALRIAPARAPRQLRAGQRRKQVVVRWITMVVAAVIFLTPLYGLFDFTSRLLNGTRRWDAWSTLVHWSQLKQAAPDLVSGLYVTLLLCLVTGVLTVVILVPTMTWVRLRVPTMRRWIELISLLPLSIPAIVLVPGLAPMYRGIAHVLSSGAIWLCFVYVILALPFSYRAVDTALSAIDVKTLSEAARSLGCSWGKVMWRIVLPNIRTGVAGAIFLTVALVLGEFTVAALLAKNTLPVALFNLGLNASGNPRLTAAVSLVMLIFGFLLMFGFSFVGNGGRRGRRRSAPAAAAVPVAPLDPGKSS